MIEVSIYKRGSDMADCQIKTGKITILLLFSVFSIFFSSCEKDKTTSVPNQNESPAGALIQTSVCKNELAKAPADTISSDYDCILYQYDGISTLTLQHINTGFNCCPDTIMADIDIEENQIHIVEKEGMGLCNCLCLFDLTYKITDVQSETYHITLSQMYLADQDSSFNVTIDLKQSASGRYCLYRQNYPWGL